ncbi:NACHT domain-containing protein [Cladophialophora immunda]|nr:NACHT domain-containing protein [Cladophialophora immunda]
MEALAAFGLACNVIQVVDASWKAYEIYTQFRERGTTARADELRHSAQHLVKCNKSLQDSLSNAPKFPLLQSGVDLSELSRNCIQSAEELEKELEKIKVGPGSSRLSTWGKTIKAKWKSERIEALKRKVDEYAGVLDSTILVHLSQNLGTLAARQTDILTQLDDWQRKIFAEINAGNTVVTNLINTSAEDVKAHTTLEHNLTRLHIETKLDDFSDTQKLRAKYDSFMESLYFPAINQRQDNIEDAHVKTFEWIFDETAQRERPWDSFLAWTQDDNPIYWVLGKAGSGKSTLMNFLVQDARTRAAFERKFADVHPLIIAFFFWEAGVDLQKNQLGLLRSLIWKTLDSMDATVAIHIWSNILQKVSPPMPTVWTQKQLLRLLQSLVQAVQNPICLFLDGLDEFQGLEDQFGALRDIIGVFRVRQQTKICMSSRPSTSLESLYTPCPKLKLQDLTEPDITLYVEDKLVKSVSAENAPRLPTLASQGMSSLIDKVVYEAEGVFLWVRLTVESLIRGIRKDDDWQTLMRRLEQMPQGIFNLYEHMWKRSALDHLSTLEKLQRIYNSSENFLVIRFLEIHHRGLEEIDEGSDEEREQRVNEDQLWRRELEKTDLGRHPGTINRLFEIQTSHRKWYVSFLHRSALEYLQTESGKQLLQAQPLSKHELFIRQSKSTLVLILLGAIDLGPNLEEGMEYIPDHSLFRAYLDTDTGVACAMFVQLEEILTKLKFLGIWKERQSTRSEDPFEADSEELDFTKAFLQFGHPAYTKHKLETSGLIHDRNYLTGLLRACIGNLRIECPRPAYSNAILLLELGADPNSTLFPISYKRDSMRLWTIWTVTLIIMWVTRSYDLHASQQLLSAFLKAGADPKPWLQCLFIRNSGSFGHENTLETSKRPFALLRAKACDLIPLGPETSMADLLRQEGAISEKRTLVAFAPPNTWCTLASENLEVDNQFLPGTPSFFKFFQSLRLYYRGSTYVAHDRDNPRFFDNGIDALRAAGFSDEEIRELPIPQTIWEGHEKARGEIHEMNAERFNDLLRQWDFGNESDSDSAEEWHEEDQS